MRILCYGDSNTFGTGPMSHLSDDPVLGKSERWPGQMSEQLGAGFDVVVEGLPGRTTVHDDPIEGEYRNGFRTLRAILESHRPIDLLIVMLGTNDAKHRFGLTAQDIALGVARLLKEAKSLGLVSKTLVICPPAVRECGDLAQVFSGAEARFVDLPDQMARFASEHGAAFFDAGTVIGVDNRDGVHFGVASHAILGQAVAHKVREIML